MLPGHTSAKKIVYADDATEKVSLLLKLRLPWLLGGLLLGVGTIFAISQFEALLAKEVRLAFFIPIMVYMSGAVAMQTQEIYVRNMNRRQAKFGIYLAKELALGMILGIIIGLALGTFTTIWLGSTAIGMTVGLAMFISLTIASVMGLLIPNILKREHQDPAVGAGPVTTVIQDFITILIYLIVASIFILR